MNYFLCIKCYFCTIFYVYSVVYVNPLPRSHHNVEHYNEAIGVLHRMFKHIFDGLEIRYARELAVIR